MKKVLLTLLLFLTAIFMIGCKEKPKDFHTKIQNNYLSGDYKNATLYAVGDSELSIPSPITLSWKNKASSYTLEVKELGKDNGLIIEVDSSSADVYNLKANTTYEWFVNGEKQGEFKTVSGLRNLYIDGLTNVRDIGGYNATGGTVKQGLLIRSSKLTDDDTGEVLITPKGIEQLKMLGIKTELDLRDTTPDSDGNIEQGGITASCVDGVNYISFPMQSGGNYLQLNRKVLPTLFKILANEDNYPILFHCSIGTDRTGVVAFLVNAILGVSEEDLYRDYLFSNFGYIHGMRHSKTIDDYISKVTMEEGKSLSENVEAYLISLGVDEQDIISVKNIMIEK